MNIDFTGQVSTYNKGKFNILSPGEQFWDGLKPEEKEGKVLVVPKYKKDENGKINYQNYENLVIEKKDKNGNGIKGIKFCIAKYPNNIKGECDANYSYENWVTGEDGKLKIPTNELPLYNQTLIETGETAKNYKPQKIDLYVDPGNRFLGEVKGNNFITYNELLSEITDIPEDEIKTKDGKNYEGSNLKYKRTTSDNGVVDINIGNVLEKGNNSSTGGNWLKIYDARKGKTLYIAKKPLTNYVSWDNLYKAGVVFGPEYINTKRGDPNLGKIKTKEELGEEIYNNFKSFEKRKIEVDYFTKIPYGEYQAKIIEINKKRYIVRLLIGLNTVAPNKPSSSGLGVTGGSEWNRYIIPLVKDYRYGKDSSDNIEEELKSLENIWNIGESSNFKTQLATYNWLVDLLLKPENSTYLGYNSKGDYSWTYEYETLNYYDKTNRGSYSSNQGAARAGSGDHRYSISSYGFRPVLEEINYP